VDHISNTWAEDLFTMICAEEPVAVLEIVSDADATGYLELSNGGNNVFKALPVIEDIKDFSRLSFTWNIKTASQNWLRPGVDFSTDFDSC